MNMYLEIHYFLLKHPIKETVLGQKLLIYLQEDLQIIGTGIVL